MSAFKAEIGMQKGLRVWSAIASLNFEKENNTTTRNLQGTPIGIPQH